MSEQLYLLTICLPLATILLVFGMRSFSAMRQAKARLDHDEAYRRIAERAVTAEAANTTALSSFETVLSDVRMRLTAIEKLLKEVE